MKKVTFEEVYANAYVRESINVLMANLINQYPMLRTDEDDIRQRLLLILDRQISKFDSEKSSLERFARITLEFGVREVRRAYFGKRELAGNKLIRLAMPIIDDIPLDTCDDSIERRELIEAIQYAMTKLTPTQRRICELLADGEALGVICVKAKISFPSLKNRHLPEIRRVLAEQLF